jgi:hypothetical protein
MRRRRQRQAILFTACVARFNVDMGVCREQVGNRT